MKNSQKGFVVPILLVIVALLVIGGGVYVYENKKVEVPVVVDNGTQQTNTQTPPVTTKSQSPTSTSGVKTKSINLAGKYTVNVPVDFTVTEVSKAITKIPVYSLGSPDGHNISISVHSYTSAESQVPGDCVVSKSFDTGTLAAPIFCEGLNLVDSFTISGNRYVKYGTVVSDTSLDCTMNSPCPVKVSAETRYSKEYVFAVPDKSRNTIIEFFAGDASRGSSNSVKGFEGISATLRNVIIPSLTALTSVTTNIPNPTPTSHDVKYFYDNIPFNTSEPTPGYKEVSIRGKLIAYEARSKPCGVVGPCEPDTTGFILEDINDKNYQIYIKLTSDSVVENLHVGDVYIIGGTLEYYGLDYTNKAKFIFNAEKVN